MVYTLSTFKGIGLDKDTRGVKIHVQMRNNMQMGWTNISRMFDQYSERYPVERDEKYFWEEG